MQEIIDTGLKEINETLEKLLKKKDETKKDLHMKLGNMAKLEVDYAIVNSGLHDTHGNVRSWQQIYIGSRGGYAAIRAQDKAAPPNHPASGGNSPGAITNYLENGRRHGIHAKHTAKAAVNGYHFYKNSEKIVEEKATQIVEKFADDLFSEMSGN